MSFSIGQILRFNEGILPIQAGFVKYIIPKSYTAHAINKLLKRSGKLWQDEPFDRYIRDQRHFDNAVAYIEKNPVKAGLCATPEAWLWSSASFSPGAHGLGAHAASRAASEEE